ncbi:ribbon-helix-helix domain-containing protein [Rickettsia felis]|uniref:ribbon-helix-helix domain-containing protein n=1 Tax=Rickettsia felis TaxID=42862 RepID=UPI0032B08B69
MNNCITTVAKLEEIPKSKLIREAIKNYLRELKEDREDAEIALARSNNPNKKILYLRRSNGIFKKEVWFIKYMFYVIPAEAGIQY